jgi:hypothetical protein
MSRTRKGTTLVIEPMSSTPRLLSDPETDVQDFLYHPEDKTPVAPPPSGSLLNHAGLGIFQRFRPILLGLGALGIMVGTFMLGMAAARRRPPAEPSIITVTTPAAASQNALEVAPLESEAAVRAAGGGEGEGEQGEGPAEAQGQAGSQHPGVAVGEASDNEASASEAAESDEGESNPVAVPLPGEVPPPPTVADTVFLSVTVSPANAVVSIDRQRMPSNPFVARFPRSLDSHVVRASAPGFETKERLVTFSDNIMLDLSLSPLSADSPSARDRPGRRPAPPASRRLSPPASTTAPGPLPLPAAGSAPSGPALLPRPADGETARRRRIEARDPYSDDSP